MHPSEQLRMDKEMHPLVREAIGKIERVYGCTVVHVATMGSRAWGFQSPESDHDIQFVYVFSKNRYAQLDPLPDTNIVFKLDEHLEFHGYELKQYLKLIRKSNTFPSELLWQANGFGPTEFIQELRKLSMVYFNRVPHWYNHSSIAFKEMQKVDESGLTDVKAFLYFARSLFTMMALEQQPDMRYLPLSLHSLIPSIVNLQDGIQSHVKYLMKMRNAGTRAMITPQIFTNMKHLLSERVAVPAPEVNASLDPVPLDKFFQAVLAERYFRLYPDTHRLYAEAPLELLKWELGQRANPIARTLRVE